MRRRIWFRYIRPNLATIFWTIGAFIGGGVGGIIWGDCKDLEKLLRVWPLLQRTPRSTIVLAAIVATGIAGHWWRRGSRAERRNRRLAGLLKRTYRAQRLERSFREALRKIPSQSAQKPPPKIFQGPDLSYEQCLWRGRVRLTDEKTVVADVYGPLCAKCRTQLHPLDFFRWACARGCREGEIRLSSLADIVRARVENITTADFNDPTKRSLFTPVE